MAEKLLIHPKDTKTGFGILLTDEVYDRDFYDFCLVGASPCCFKAVDFRTGTELEAFFCTSCSRKYHNSLFDAAVVSKFAASLKTQAPDVWRRCVEAWTGLEDVSVYLTEN